MSRLFTFGDSFTCYKWPTWADIMAIEYDEFQNWARPGAGNHFIFYSLIEALNTQNISKDDTVMIMWSSPTREDHWVEGEWVLPGPLGSKNNLKRYGDHYLKQFLDPTGYLIKSLAVIDGARRILKDLGCKFHLMQGISLWASNDLFSTSVIDTAHDIKTVYSETLDLLHPCFDEAIGKRLRNHGDVHPDPYAHYRYLESLNLTTSLDQKLFAMDAFSYVRDGKPVPNFTPNYRTDRI